MTDYERCAIMLGILFPDQYDLQERWWNSANKAFDGIPPKIMLETNPQSVVKYLTAQFSGDFL